MSISPPSELDEGKMTRSTKGDEDLLANSNASPSLVDDPAILEVRGLQVEVEHQEVLRYSKEKLLAIRALPLSKRRPECLEDFNCSLGIWGPERCNLDRKRSETPNEEERGVRELPAENHKRRSGDPRERIRKEQDGIVLSPQRRSFNTGCFMPVTHTMQRRPDSPLGGSGKGGPGVAGGERGDAFPKERDVPPARRIGSGRILARDVSWDYRPEKTEIDDFNFRPGGVVRGGERDERYDRRSFGRDFERDKDPRYTRERDGRNMRYSGGDRRRAYSDGREDEPEWFSGGPTSQLDTIELRGFEDIPEEKPNTRNNKKQSPPQKKNAKKDKDKDRDSDKDSNKENNRDKNKSLCDDKSSGDGQQNGIQDAEHGISAPSTDERTSPKHMDSSIIDMSVTEAPALGSSTQSTALIVPDTGFNIDDFLKYDSIPGMLSNGGDGGETAGSRFSQWFRHDSPVNIRPESRRSSFHEELNNIVNDITEPKISIPRDSDSNKYFAPISPAANSDAPGPNSLLEMLQRGNKPQVPDIPGKIHSLEELEARMRHGQGNGYGLEKPTNRTEDEMLAFKKLLAQVSSALPATNGPATQKPQPMSLMEMLSKSQQADENAARGGPSLSSGNFGAPSPTGQGPQIPQELVMKLLQLQQHQQRQQDIIQKFMNTGNLSNRHFQPSPDVAGIIGHQYNRDLLQRPEAQAILQGIKRGEINHQHLLQQLSNPAMNQRHRDIVICILKSQGMLNMVSPRTASPVPPVQPPNANSEIMQHLMFPPQQLRVSPLPPNAIPQRIPSPRELQAHTQSIMQSALIKKKLEEQRENYRKRQEQLRSHSPSISVPNVNSGTGANSPAKHMSSPTPLAFTPTSVLRKMTADKEPELSGVKDLSKDNKMAGNILNMRPQNQALRPTVGINWNTMTKQPQGRPIVKGGAGANAGAQMQFASNVEYQQQMHNPQYNMNMQRSKINAPPQGLNNLQQQQQQQQQPYGLQQQYNNMMHQQRPVPNMGNNSNHVRTQQIQAQLAQQMQQQQQRSNFQQQMMHNPMMAGGRPKPGILGFNQRDGALSPTSNQLARWFSPELLAQASAGKLPPVNLAQNALSLEELERIQQSSTTVHN